MPATFSWRQHYASQGTTKDYDTGNVVNFFGGTTNDDTAVRQIATGTTNYNSTASNIQAGSNSWPIHMRFRFETGGAGTFNNLKFWKYTTAGFDTGSMNVVGTIQAGFTFPTSRSTATNQASSVELPTSNSSTTAPGPALDVGSVSTSGAGTVYSPSYVVYQLTTATNAPAGDTGLAGFTGQYDES